MEQNKDQDVEIDLKEIFAILIDRIWIIIFSAVVVAALVGVFTKVFITPMYTSSTKVYVINRQNEESAVTYSDLQSGSSLTKDYAVIVTGTKVLEQVIDDLNLDMSVSALSQRITVTNPTDTRFIAINVQNEDPVVAQQIAVALAETSASVAIEVMDIKKVSIAENATLPINPSSPSLKKNVAIGGVAGAFVAIAIIIIIYLLNDSIRTPEDVKRYLELNTLGQVPMLEGSTNKKNKGKKRTKRGKISAADVSDDDDKLDVTNAVSVVATDLSGSGSSSTASNSVAASESIGANSSNVADSVAVTSYATDSSVTDSSVADSLTTDSSVTDSASGATNIYPAPNAYATPDNYVAPASESTVSLAKSANDKYVATDDNDSSDDVDDYINSVITEEYKAEKDKKDKKKKDKKKDKKDKKDKKNKKEKKKNKVEGGEDDE